MLSKIQTEILSLFPSYLAELFAEVPPKVWEKACEIRFRIQQPILIVGIGDEYRIHHLICHEDMLRVLENFSDNSIYAIQNEMNAGFLTLKGGHRVGIAGTSVWEENQIKNLKYISSFNIRIAREAKNCGIPLLQLILKSGFQNTMLISPPRMWQNHFTTRHDPPFK